MKPVLFLRIASVLTFVHTVLHTIGGAFGTAAPGAQQTAVLAMKTNQFPVMGVTRSYWDFHLGFSWFVSVMLLVEAIVFWQLGSLAKTGVWRLRPILLTFLVGYMCLATDAFAYFFAPPAIVEIMIALCLGLAALTCRPVPNDILNASSNKSDS
jgi:hypothetical protein